MKKFISKIKKSCHRFMTGKSGFSLVELIVVIAIMAVMAAVLAPALLGYVERSRAQKDTSAMSEVTNAIQLSLADQNVYDELLPYAVKGNFSCYADGDTSTNTDANKTITKAPDYWLFTDEARKLDETAYFPAGSMRGATVTFKPNGEAEYILKAGIVNQIGDESTKKGTNGGVALEDCPELYNRLRSTVGDTIKVSSQTYRNSSYTIFISMGTTGGNQADKQDAIQVYGQYNGTNLPEVMTATGSASQDKGNAGSGQPDGGDVPSTPAELTTLTAKTWNGLTNFSGYNIWSDGTNTYYSEGTKQYVLKGDTWETKVWNGLTDFYGPELWSDGTNIYYTGYDAVGDLVHYILNGDTWESASTKCPPDAQTDFIWTDGTNVYYSGDTGHYVLDGDRWKTKTWNIYCVSTAYFIWTDGINTYCSGDGGDYVLNGDMWEIKVWNSGPKTEENNLDIYPEDVWTDGTNTYYSYRGQQYILRDDTWELKTWNGFNNINGARVWTDGTNYYYSSGTDHYVFS